MDESQKKPFYEVAIDNVRTLLCNLTAPLRGKLNLIDMREALRQQTIGAFHLMIDLIMKTEVPAGVKQKIFSDLMGLAESVGQALGVREREQLEHVAAQLRGRDQVTPKPTGS